MSPKFKLVLPEGRMSDLARNLKIGDTLLGKVKKKLGPDRYIVHFQGQDIIASYGGFLKLGSLIRTVAQTIKPQIVLKVLPGGMAEWDGEEMFHYSLRRLGRRKGNVFLNPELSQVLNDTHMSFTRSQKREDTDGIVGELEKELVSFFSDLTFASFDLKPKSISGDFQRGIEKRMSISTKTLLNSIRRLQSWISDGEEERSPNFLEEVQLLCLNLQHLYLNLRLEAEGLLAQQTDRNWISFLQIPFFKKSFYQRVLIFFKKDTEAAFLGRAYWAEHETPFDFKWDPSGDRIAVKERSLLFHENLKFPLLELIQKSDCGVELFKGPGDPWEEVFGSQAEVLELGRPQTLNLVV